MPKLSEKGAIQFIVPLILLLGIVATVYLTQQTQIFKPKAYGGLVSGPIPPPPPPPPPGECKSRIGDFAVSDSCDEVENGFRFAKFSCDVKIRLPNVKPQGGGKPQCRSIEEWVSIAEDSCKSLCPTSSPTPIPLPSPISCAPWEFLCGERCQLRWEPCPEQQ